MTLTASVPTFHDGEPSGEFMTITGDADVTRLVELLAHSWADTASLETADTVLNVHIHDGWGYLLYSGDAGYLITNGEPASPAVESETGFPAGSGLPVDRVIAAVREFVRTQRLPETVLWRDATGERGARRP